MAQQNNPFYVDPTGGVNNQGAWNALNRGISNVGNVLQQKRETDQQNAARNEVNEAVGSGDNDKIADVMIKHPEYAKTIRDAIGYKSAATEKNALDSAKSILANPDDTETILANRIKAITDEGGDPSDSIMALRQYREDPENFQKSTETFLALHDPKAFKSYTSATGQEAMTPYQKQIVGLKKQDQELRQLDIQQKQLQAQAAQETNDLKKQEIQARIDKTQSTIKAKQQKAQAAAEKVQKDNQEAITTTQDTLSTVNEMLKHPGLDSAVGLSSAVWTRPGSDAANFETLFDTFTSKQTMDNMGKMKGVLSDTDIKMLKSASSGLELKMSEDEFKKRLMQIRDKLRTKLGAQSGDDTTTGVTTGVTGGDTAPQVTNGNYNSLWGD